MVKKVTKRVRLDFKGAKGAIKEEMKRQAGEILVEEIIKDLSASRSPVSGGKYKKLKKNKKPADLFEDGDLYASIQYEEYRDGVEVGVFDESQTPKAKGHNTGFKGHPTIPQGKYKREFIPKKDQVFKKKIIEKVNKQLKELAKEEKRPSEEGQ